jgi:nucleotide-binding universal stress UspA family protein
MMYETLMVYLEEGADNSGLLSVAAKLADVYNANVIGIAASQPVAIGYADSYLASEVVNTDREDRLNAIQKSEADFKDALEGRAKGLEWAWTITTASLSGFVAGHARRADLVILGVSRPSSLLDLTRHLDVADLVMQVGRPVLVVPHPVRQLQLGHILLGWKDTREVRRAASDALPFLKKAERVTIVEIAPAADLSDAQRGLDDVAQWLGRHGIAARTLAVPAAGDDAASLSAIVADEGADLVVAGAYGHSRLQEWVLGGVTRDLLRHVEWCSLLSH